MDRQVHDYAAASAMAYAQQQRQAANIQQQQQQQQQQFGFHAQHQQFPSSVHGPPMLPPHPSMQQFPYHHPLQQQPQQLHPHHPPHPHLLHLQQQQQPPPPAFAPHLAPSIASPFHGPYDTVSPPPVPPPLDPELQKRIDKLVEYNAKNGPEFEAMIREKQQDNPAYSFLFGGEGHSYYRYRLWLTTRPTPGGSFNPPFPSSSIPIMHPPPNQSHLNAPPLNAAALGPSGSMMGASQIHQPPFPPFYDQQHHQHAFGAHVRPDYDPSSRSFKGLSGPLPSDVAMELNNVLSTLTGAKESIKNAKTWFMQRSPFAPALAEALRDAVFNMDDSERQLHIIYLVNDILFESLARRAQTHDLDNEALAFKPVLGAMLARVYHNPQIKEENLLKLQKLVQFWASQEVYDQDTIHTLEGEMTGGPPTFTGFSKDFPSSIDSSAGLLHTPNTSTCPWQPDRQTAAPSFPIMDHPDKHPVPGQGIPSSLSPQQFLPNATPTGSFAVGPMAIPPSVQPPNLQAPANIGEKLPPYPLFPPGLIPGMVRKMQIGSGVPYSSMSPLDIPTVIPPSTVSQSEVLERVSKFFKEIGEVNPSEGPMKSDRKDDDDDDYVYEREPMVRKGGACIPPPPSLQLDPETGAYADGSVDPKSGSGRLGLGAAANPNEESQYDDVYTSYRKQRSTNYHSSMSSRASVK